MLIKTLTICITLGVVFAQGNTFNGIVFDSEKKIPIPSANIQIKNSELGTSSDDLGKFSFDIETNGDFEIIISVIGYNDTTVVISNGYQKSVTKIFINPNIIEFDEVHVYSHRHNDSDNAPSSIALFGNRFQKTTKNSLASTLAGESGLLLEDLNLYYMAQMP